jgi:hypothetical protein
MGRGSKLGGVLESTIISTSRGLILNLLADLDSPSNSVLFIEGRTYTWVGFSSTSKNRRYAEHLGPKIQLVLVNFLAEFKTIFANAFQLCSP